MGLITILSGIMLVISIIGLLYISDELQQFEKKISFSKYFSVSKEFVDTAKLNIIKYKNYKRYAEYCMVFFAVSTFILFELYSM